MSKVVVISGPPCAGKTTLANHLSNRLQLPILAKDALKESLADNLGYSDRKRSVELGYAAFQLHLQLARELASKNVGFIFETAFYKQSTSDIAAALAGCEIIQAWVIADIDVMLRRARTRERHPGHADWYEGYEQECRGKLESGVYDALDIGGALIKVDSNDFESRKYTDTIENLVRKHAA
ncbi:MAG: AAA family ATPase [Dehalococcoidia bacterium]|jgi:predicted kinase|nr:AAA family ATPase [Dehalococcoidia bacterium]|tara:strand:+ start:958 stop:1500 length:543 start_codon:yes stop_codon:yes gene_type:complete